MLDELDSMDVDAQEFAATMKKPKQSVQHQVQRKKGEIFSTASELGDDKLIRLGEELERRKTQMMQEEGGTAGKRRPLALIRESKSTTRQNVGYSRELVETRRKHRRAGGGGFLTFSFWLFG
jgi:hypothetical protein